MADDRRQHERRQKVIRFQCYIDGHRFDTASLDISTGGAFLETDDDIRMGAVVMIVPVREMKKKLPVVLVGTVVRKQLDPTAGLGIEWHKCVTRNGIQQIFDFMAFYLDLYPSHLPLPAPGVSQSKVVAYDFRRGHFYIPNLPPADDSGKDSKGEAGKSPDAPPAEEKPADQQPAAAPPKPKARPATTAAQVGAGGENQEPSGAAEDSSDKLAKPPKYAHAAGPGHVTKQISEQNTRIPVTIPVQLFVHDHIYDGTIRQIGTRTLSVSMDECPENVSNSTPLVALPVPVKGRQLKVYLACTPKAIEEYRTTSAVALEMAINKVEREDLDGLFERYIRFLFFKLVAQG